MNSKTKKLWEALVEATVFENHEDAKAVFHECLNLKTQAILLGEKETDKDDDEEDKDEKSDADDKEDGDNEDDAKDTKKKGFPFKKKDDDEDEGDEDTK